MLLDVLDHRVRPPLDLQALGKRKRPETGDDLLRDGDDLLGLLGRPHGRGELRISVILAQGLTLRKNSPARRACSPRPRFRPRRWLPASISSTTMWWARGKNVHAALPAWMMVYRSLTSSTTRPISLRARSGAVLTVTSLKGPVGWVILSLFLFSG